MSVAILHTNYYTYNLNLAFGLVCFLAMPSFEYYYNYHDLQIYLLCTLFLKFPILYEEAWKISDRTSKNLSTGLFSIRMCFMAR